MKNKFALIGLVAASAMLIGCSSTQCRDGDTCATGEAACCGSCQSEKDCSCGACGADKESCCGTCGGGEHAHDHGDKKVCGPDCTKPCCAS